MISKKSRLFLVLSLALILSSGILPALNVADSSQVVFDNGPPRLEQSVNETPPGAVPPLERFRGRMPYNPAVVVSNDKAVSEVFPTQFSTGREAQTSPYSSHDASQSGLGTSIVGEPILDHIPITVNVVMTGLPSSLSDPSRYSGYLRETYAQIDISHQDQFGWSPVYAQYDITYNFVSAPSSFVSGYVDYLLTNSVIGLAPPWLQGQGVSTVRMVTASDAENYVWSNLVSGYDGYTVVLLNPSAFPFYHFYNGSSVDADFGVDPSRISSNYMVAYGGAHRMLFVDLDAGPEGYSESWGGDPLIPLWKLDLANINEFRIAVNEIGYAIRHAVEGRFLASFVYQPAYHPVYLLNVTIYSFDMSTRWSNYIDPIIIQQRFAQLQPLSSIETVRVREIDARADTGFYAAFQSASYTVVISGVEYTLHDSAVIEDYISSHLDKYASRTLIINGDPVKVIPTVILAGVDSIDADYSGIAFPGSDGNFAVVIEIMPHFYREVGIGLTSLTIHEAGHAFGLSHPHDIWDSENGIKQYWLWDFSSTPMSYCCKRDIYDALAIDNLAQGLTGYLLNQTIFLEDTANEIYDRLGYGIVPSRVASELAAAQSSVTAARSKFSASSPDFVAASANALEAKKHILNAINALYESLLSISYVVKDGQGRPIAGATVRITFPNGTEVSARTNAAGLFQVSNLPWGTYQYRIIYNGNLVGGSIGSETTSRTRTLPAKVFSLGIQRLLVTNGATLNLPISLTAPNGTSYTVRPGFVQEQAQNGTWTLSVTYQGVQVYSDSLYLDASMQLAIALRASDFTIEILDAKGSPLGNSPFQLRAANDTLLSLLTDNSGRFRLGTIPNGRYTVVRIDWQAVVVTPPTGTTVFVSESTLFTIKASVFDLRLRVSDFLGFSVSGASVALQHPNGTFVRVTTDVNGVATFRKLPEGQYDAEVSYLGQRTVLQIGPSQLSEGLESSRLTLSLPSLGIMAGIPVLPIIAAIYAVQRARERRRTTQLSQAQTPMPAATLPVSLTPQGPVTEPQARTAQLPQLKPSPPPPQASDIRLAQIPPPLSPPHEPPPRVQTEEPRLLKSPQFCPTCGTRQYQDARFCHSCGRQFQVM